MPKLSIPFVAAVGIASMIVLASAAPRADAGAAHSLTLDQRVDYQRRIERMRYTQRIENTRGAHRSFEAILSDESIRAKVEIYLLQGEALEPHWNISLTAARLQAEMDRMARNTKSPERLQELFAALDNDPYVIAECLARPILTERLIHTRYARDSRLHAAIRAQAEAALAAAGGSIEALRAQGQDYDEQVWERGDAPESAGPFGELAEDDARFFVRKILEQNDTQVRIATISWPKVTFEAWWNAARGELDLGAVHPIQADYRLPVVSGSACTPDTWIGMYPEVPSPRGGHSAVWTGAEMIVWGGDGGGNVGGRYDPATDTWTPVSPGPNVPTARGGHAAVWTGTEMIIWGGYSSSDVNTGGRYNPATDTWIATSTGTHVPAPRVGATAVWTGTEMIVWGGLSYELFTEFDTGGRYNPTTDTWLPTGVGANLPHRRVGHTAAWTGTQMIVWGGAWDAANDQDPANYLNSGARYDPSADTWTPTSLGAGVPSARSGHTAVWTGTQMIVWGGRCCADPQGVPPTTYFNTGGRYDPATDTWTATNALDASVPARRVGHTAVWTGTRMIVWGGSNTSSKLQTGGSYDPMSNTWTATSALGLSVPSARGAHSAVWTGAEMIVWGGSIGSGQYSNTGGRYDPSTNSWVTTNAVTTFPAARVGHTAVWTGSEMIIWGGAGNSIGGSYDPATDSWSPTSTGANVPIARGAHTAVWTGTEMIVWGGSAGADAELNSGARYSPATDTWLETSTGANVPGPRYHHTAVWTGNEMIVWGGSHWTGSFYTPWASGGRYVPDTDSWTPTGMGPGLPAARWYHSAVWSGSEMIVWGGREQSSSSYLYTGGRYDPSTNGWTATSTGPNLPESRRNHAAVWTGIEMIVWGGLGPSGELNSGGRYEPLTDSWKTTSPGPGVPTARDGSTGVWTGTQAIFWGGYGAGNDGGSYTPDTDSWYPTTTDYAPSGYVGHSAVWTGAEMIVWGGNDVFGLGTQTGGRYCQCAASTWYRDADGDGHGDPLTPGAACVLPAGYTTIADDCDDSSVSVHPGSVELCNSIDDDCNLAVDDGITIPSTPYVTAFKSGISATFTWTPALTATGHDAVKGHLADLLATSGDFSIATSECLHPTSNFVDDQTPPEDVDGLWFLIRVKNCAGIVSYDSGDPAQVGSRDAEIAVICP